MDCNKPLWPPCALLEWALLRLDDKAYQRLYRGTKHNVVPGTDIPLSGDPILDAEIIQYYEGLKHGKP